MSWVTELLINIGYAAAILIAAFWLSGFISKRLRWIGKYNGRLDETLFGFLASASRWAVLAIAATFVLGRFGIQTTSLVALLGAAGLAIGLALQGTLSNLAAGVMLLGFRPFKVGDYIVGAGQSGTVDAITLFTTELRTPDNIQVIVPNGDLWASSIQNFSYHSTRRVDFIFGVSYDSDLKKAEEIIRTQIAADPRAHAEPAPFVKVSNLGDFSVDFTVRVWVNAPDYWDFKFDMTRSVKEAFDAGGIEIPFPTQTELVKRIPSAAEEVD